jgi:glycosyltransferase involved in cell wall biosynthesis
MNNLVSIIISVYNGDSAIFLKESITSIINQSYKNIEIILIDDGVSDSDLKLTLDNLINQHKNLIHYFPQDVNKGLASCMNQAISLSKGDFLARIDADDIMHESRIEIQLEFLQKNHNIDIVGSWIKEFNVKSGYEKLVKFPICNAEMRKLFGKRNPLAHPSVMMRKSFFNKAGVYPLGTNTDEDTMLWLNGFLNECVFANIPLPLTEMRVSDDFFGRRSGMTKARQDFMNRHLVIKQLALSRKNYLYAFARFILQITPSSMLKRFAYHNLR